MVSSIYGKESHRSFNGFDIELQTTFVFYHKARLKTKFEDFQNQNQDIASIQEEKREMVEKISGDDRYFFHLLHLFWFLIFCFSIHAQISRLSILYTLLVGAIFQPYHNGLSRTKWKQCTLKSLNRQSAKSTRESSNCAWIYICWRHWSRTWDTSTNLQCKEWKNPRRSIAKHWHYWKDYKALDELVWFEKRSPNNWVVEWIKVSSFPSTKLSENVKSKQTILLSTMISCYELYRSEKSTLKLSWDWYTTNLKFLTSSMLIPRRM